MKKDTILRDNHESVQFVRLTKNTFFDERLTDAGCRLLMAMINNAEEWKVNVTYYGKKFGWSPGKLAGAKKNLITCGYLKEETKMTSKGKVYNYTISESLAKTENILNSETEVRIPKSENRNQDSKVRNLDANNINVDKNNTEEINVDKRKERIINESVSVVSNEVPFEVESKQKYTNTSLPLKEDFFFKYGERPSEEKIIAYVEQKGFSRETGRDIYIELLNKDFKNVKGTPIKGIEKYIDTMLTDKSKHSHYASIDSFIQALLPVNEVYIRNSINENKNSSIDWQTSRLYGKEAASEFWNGISKDKDDYIRYMMDFVKANGWKSMASFKAYVCKHHERQVQSVGKTYI